jgi:hypothetical protein
MYKAIAYVTRVVFMWLFVKKVYFFRKGRGVTGVLKSHEGGEEESGRKGTLIWSPSE